MPDTLMSKKIGNPYFICDDNEIHIFAEGTNDGGWHLFYFSLYNNIISRPVLLINNYDILANPSMEKFGDVFYLYYGKYIKHSYKVFVATAMMKRKQTDYIHGLNPTDYVHNLHPEITPRL
jgi:hypothetical protein